MVIFLIIIFHMVLLVTGMKSFKGKKKIHEICLFILLILFSTYMGISRPASLPIVPLMKGVEFIFEPFGRWIEWVLGK